MVMADAAPKSRRKGETGHGDASADIVPSRRAGVSEAERLEASHELSRAWGDAVIDVTFPIGERTVRLDTARELAAGREDTLFSVHGTIGKGSFAFELTESVFQSLTADLPDPVDPEALSATDAALVVEHALSEALGFVERETGEPVQIESVDPGPLVTELEPIIAMVWIDRQRVALRAVFGDPLHMRILTEWLRPQQMSDEFAAGEETRVEVGPIELSFDDLDELEVGDALAIGTEPGQNLVGRLVRGTGRIVPVSIDTAQVIVEGPMQEVGEDDPQVDPVPLGVAIGTVRMTPAHLVRAKAGGRFIMERNPDNECAIMLDGRVIARGALTLIDGQLGVEIGSLGSGPLPVREKPTRASTEAVPAEPTPGIDDGEGADEPIDDDMEAEALTPGDTFRVG